MSGHTVSAQTLKQILEGEALPLRETRALGGYAATLGIQTLWNPSRQLSDTAVEEEAGSDGTEAPPSFLRLLLSSPLASHDYLAVFCLYACL